MKIVNMMAVSLDGCIAATHEEEDHVRRDYGFVDAADRNLVMQELMEADAVICGSSTMIASQKIWELENLKGKFPEWYIFTNKGLPNHLPFWNQEKISRYLISKNPLAVGKSSSTLGNLSYGESMPAQFLYDHLSQRKDIEKVLLFGGGYINQMFYNENLVDELKITICPIIIASTDAAKFVMPSLPKFIKFELTSSNTIGNHVFLSYTVQKVKN